MVESKHHTYSIIVQKDNLLEKVTDVSLQANYDFSRKEHRSFKGNPWELPPAHFKRAPVIIWKYFRTDETKNCKDSALKTVAQRNILSKWFLLGVDFKNCQVRKI